MRTLRVFVRRTRYTPIDDLAWIGDPPLPGILPPFDRIDVSVVFTWDIERAYKIGDMFKAAFNMPVSFGGPAFRSVSAFVPGLYVRPGVTFTTRGCDFHCPWCLVPRHEGKFRCLAKIAPGNIVQDNNLLLAPKTHLDKVFQMLRQQKRIRFTGGLDTRLLQDWHIEELRGLAVKEIWLACDSETRRSQFGKAVRKLSKAGFSRRKIRAYCLIGYDGESMENAEDRLEYAYAVGSLPFAQYHRPPSGEYAIPQAWRKLVRDWSRPYLTLLNHSALKHQRKT